MTEMNYILEIYEPGSEKDLWVSFSSPTPFMNINVGDFINPGIWPNSQAPMRILRAINVEHAIWEIGGKIAHKVKVFTEEIENKNGLRMRNLKE